MSEKVGCETSNKQNKQRLPFMISVSLVSDMSRNYQTSQKMFLKFFLRLSGFRSEVGRRCDCGKMMLKF